MCLGELRRVGVLVRERTPMLVVIVLTLGFMFVVIFAGVCTYAGVNT